MLSRLEGSGDEEEAVKRRRARANLLDGLHGRAWKRCEHLAKKQKEVIDSDGEELVFEALATLDKEAIVNNGTLFDHVFKKSPRKYRQADTDYIAEKERIWEDLNERDEETSLSQYTMAYF